MDDRELEGPFREQVEKAWALSQWMHSTLAPLKFEREDVRMAAASLYGLGHRHFDAMLVLLKADLALTGSAFALTRPVTEAFFRAMWLEKADDPALALVELHSDKNIKLEKIAEVIKAKTTPEAAAVMEQFLRDNTKVMHGLTHGGGEHIRSWFNGTRLGPFYSFRDRMAVVEIGWRIALSCAVGVAGLSKNPSTSFSLNEDATGRVPRLLNDVLAELEAKKPA